MFITLSPQNPDPLYKQVTDRVIDAITDGTLRVGEKLPSIREFARDLKISEITVKRAYTDLDAGGFIYTRAGLGSFVADVDKNKLRKKKLKALRKEVKKLLRTNENFGIGADDIVQLIQEEKDG